MKNFIKSGVKKILPSPNIYKQVGGSFPPEEKYKLSRKERKKILKEIQKNLKPTDFKKYSSKIENEMKLITADVWGETKGNPYLRKLLIRSRTNEAIAKKIINTDKYIRNRLNSKIKDLKGLQMEDVKEFRELEKLKADMRKSLQKTDFYKQKMNSLASKSIDGINPIRTAMKKGATRGIIPAAFIANIASAGIPGFSKQPIAKLPIDPAGDVIHIPGIPAEISGEGWLQIDSKSLAIEIGIMLGILAAGSWASGKFIYSKAAEKRLENALNYKYKVVTRTAKRNAKKQSKARQEELNKLKKEEKKLLRQARRRFNREQRLPVKYYSGLGKLFDDALGGTSESRRKHRQEQERLVRLSKMSEFEIGEERYKAYLRAKKSKKRLRNQRIKNFIKKVTVDNPSKLGRQSKRIIKKIPGKVINKFKKN